MNARLLIPVLLVTMLSSRPAAEPETGSSLPDGRLRVREVTIFKDGHAFVREEGRLPVSPGGRLELDRLPRPVLGMFWPYLTEPGATLASATAGLRRSGRERAALSIPELLAANPGAKVLVTTDQTFEAAVAGVPEPAPPSRDGEPEHATAAGLRSRSSLVLLHTARGLQALPLDQIRTVTFLDGCKETVPQEEQQPYLSLTLGRNGGRQPSSAGVGLAYLQKGLRWIPGYRVELDGAGQARVTLQATIVNDLTDLEETAVNLAVGVTSFLFAKELDPLALERQPAGLSRFFTRAADPAMLSNAIMTQQIAPASPPESFPAGGDGPETGVLPGEGRGESREDLYLFKIPSLTLAKGERTVLTVASFSARCRDLYTLEVPLIPPGDLQRNMDSNSRAGTGPAVRAGVTHQIILANSQDFPFTTAPAMMMREGRLLAQGLLTYTPPGAESRVELTRAVNIQADWTSAETGRVPEAVRWQGDGYTRVELEGRIRLVNRHANAVMLEVARTVPGQLTSCNAGGRLEQVDMASDPAGFVPDWWEPWWRWGGWPWWWSHFNGAGRVCWQLKLEPGQTVELTCRWHYFWH